MGSATQRRWVPWVRPSRRRRRPGPAATNPAASGPLTSGCTVSGGDPRAAAAVLVRCAAGPQADGSISSAEARAVAMSAQALHC